MRIFCKFWFCISAIFLLTLLVGCGKAEYSVKDFADVTVVGYTEHGTLSIKVKDSAVNKIYADGKKDKTAALRFAETFDFTYEGQDEEDSYFSNGDIVTINVTYDKSLASALGVSFVDSSFQYTIDGLEDKLETSPFEGLNVKFSGVAPYGSVQLDKSNCIQYVIDNVTFHCDNYDLSNGDKVVVYADFNSEIAERNGYVFTEEVKKYTVVGLSKYVKTMSDVSYDETTAKMRKMVETYMSEDEDNYKSFNWFFGEEDSDSDEETENDEQDNELTFDSNIMDDNEFFTNNDDYDNEDDNDGEDSFNSSAEKKKKKVSDVQRIKNDFVLSDFKVKFDYIPVSCYYSMNRVELSDNFFYSIYKIKGTFLCEESGGSGFIKPGDTLVGELYIISKLAGGSVDIKNNLYYEDSVLKNYHSYSIHSVPKYQDVEAELFGSTSYMVETLPYIEDEDAYRAFVRKLETKTKRKEESHITIDTSNDKEDEKKRESSQDEVSSNADEIQDGEYTDYSEYGDDIQYYDSQGELYDDNGGAEEYDPGNDYGYGEDGYDAGDF